LVLCQSGMGRQGGTKLRAALDPAPEPDRLSQASILSSCYVICTVQDNGSPPRNVVPGRGLKIVHELIGNLNGNLNHKFGSDESIVCRQNISDVGLAI
jgi:hypothetical protein